MNFFLDNDFFRNTQYGFLKGRSTVLQLLSIIDEWTTNLDSDGQIDCIYMDFEKAFDKVPHRCLISKLQAYGIHSKILLSQTFWTKGNLELHLMESSLCGMMY